MSQCAQGYRLIINLSDQGDTLRKNSSTEDIVPQAFQIDAPSMYISCLLHVVHLSIIQRDSLNTRGGSFSETGQKCVQARPAGQHKCHPVATTMPSNLVEVDTAIRNFAIRDSIIVACISHLDVNYSPPLSSARAPAGLVSSAFLTSRSLPQGFRKSKELRERARLSQLPVYRLKRH